MPRMPGAAGLLSCSTQIFPEGLRRIAEGIMKLQLSSLTTVGRGSKILNAAETSPVGHRPAWTQRLDVGS